MALSQPPLYWWAELLRRLEHIDQRMGRIMALVSIEQSELDNIAATVSTVADDLKVIIANPNPLAPADETALLAAVDKLQALDVKPTPEPAPEPATP